MAAVEVMGQNEFGNFLLRDQDNAYWRICPEELSCEIVANNLAEFSKLLEDEEFLLDWEMSALVELARQCVGLLKNDRVYYLVIPAVLGGEYDESNIRSVPLSELISLTGDWAREIANLPDGAKVQIRVID